MMTQTKRSKTTIHSNGSKWLGEAPDSIDTLLSVLAREPLDPTFERYGNFAQNVPGSPGMVHFWGNFSNVSHVFSIETNDPETCARLFAAIQENIKSAAYLEERDARKMVRS